MWITQLAIRRRVTMIMIVGAFLVLGYTRLQKMPVEYFPNVDFPVVTVFTTYPGAGPEEIQERVTKPLEDALAVLNGVEDVVSQSQENISSVSVEFDLEVDIDVAAADVRDAVTRAKAAFPDDVEEPVVFKLELSGLPVISMGVTGDRSAKDLLNFVDDRVKSSLGEVPGVAAVNVSGGEVREIQVQAHAGRLEAAGLSVAQLAQLVAAENLNVPAGDLDEGGRSFAVRAMGEVESLEEIRRLRIPTPLSGLVYLEELADVVDTSADAETITRLNGHTVVNIDVMKQSGANSVAVSEGIRANLEELKRILPKDIDFNIYRDSAEDTTEAINDVRAALILGALLAAVVTFVFLHNFRALIIVCLAIPTSLIATFFPIYFFGFTINVMTLLGLSLVVGTLVDDSIVVIENIERHRQMGEDPKEAALNGRAEISGAAVATTLVDVVVFVPVAFMGGVVGRFFFSFGITVATASIFSLLAAFTLTPMLASWWFSRETAEQAERQQRSLYTRFWGTVDRPFRALEAVYRRFLPLTLRHPFIAVALGYAALIGVSAASFKSGRVGFEFFPQQDTGQVRVLLEAAPGTRVEVMNEHLKVIEKRLLDREKYPEVRDVGASAGTQGAAFFGAGNTGGRYGFVNIILLRKSKRIAKGLRSDQDFAVALREDLADLPSVEVKVVRTSSEGGGTEAPIQIILLSPDAHALHEAARELADRMSAIPQLLYVDLSSEPGLPEVRARIDRVRAAEMGFTAAQIAATLRAAYAGDTSSQYREAGDEFDLRTQLTEFDRTHIDEVKDLFLGLSPTGQTVRLGDVATIYQSTGPSRIERHDRERSVTVSAYLMEGVVASVGQGPVQAILTEMKEGGELTGVGSRWGGEVEQRGEEFGYIGEALILAILLIYIVIAAQYTHVLQPLNVMFTIPMAFGGGILALAAWGNDVTIASLIGLIMLQGLVGKNAILVVDYTNTLRARGMDKYEALLEAGPTRMRPIFMTTVSTVAALLPTALALSEAAEFRAPMAQVVVGGLVLSTVLSLLVTPAFYVITDDITELYSRMGRWIVRVTARWHGGGES